MYENVKAQGLGAAVMDAKQIQPIMDQVDMLEKSLCRMQGILQALESRLSPVTRPLLVNAQCKQPPDMAHASPMTQRLISLNMAVERQLDQVAAFLDSLEI